jgi:hypothetical protein
MKKIKTIFLLLLSFLITSPMLSAMEESVAQNEAQPENNKRKRSPLSCLCRISRGPADGLRIWTFKYRIESMKKDGLVEIPQFTLSQEGEEKIVVKRGSFIFVWTEEGPELAKVEKIFLDSHQIDKGSNKDPIKIQINWFYKLYRQTFELRKHRQIVGSNTIKSLAILRESQTYCNRYYLPKIKS